jgi:hypothetical protein
MRRGLIFAILIPGLLTCADDPPKKEPDRPQTPPSAREDQSVTATDAPGLHVWFSLARVEGRRYRRPYLAVWLEDHDGYPVKTGVLWLQTSQPGPRWHRDLTRWYRNDRMRAIAEGTELIDAISGPTRGPGDYECHFDGTDQLGKPLPPGSYTLCIEAAREHGTYKIIREKFDWGKPFERKDLAGNTEISQAALRFTCGT